ncbi:MULTISPECIES: peptidoglycan bridge formation glycyltransferase FemA/FemB family protein [Maribacter]|uniref:Acetyltransferase (GNAT) domain-containing protein n=1 Tax=Maribacter stanieri TaxID=440514 RepID=A0A1I6JSU3_9FLAO|nr:MULTISPECIES: peptidoglycan bridge formation glycyltransferase FemA/FemB family protein [Maribacter]SFR81991.1 Acetyltransferase (GNAT) domain-containing protein [Maribacter stanieri]|tara:strand:- start:1386 stop:2453 length:1068 start_codon:yes stop_codon:yes gene_type:complete
MIETIKQKEEWVKQLELIGNTDFYFTYDYHQLSKNDDENPVLLKYNEGNSTILLPLLLRNIKGTSYIDATSVYGYAGVLSNINDNSFEKSKFQEILHSYLMDNKIISVFSRLHPFLDNQESLLSGLGEISDQGMVVYLDLSLPIEIQRANFNRRLKTYLNKARKVCTVSEGNHQEDLKSFIELYHENMRRVDATDSYFFDQTYFERIMASKDYNPQLMICRDNDSQKIIGAAIFIKKDNIVQYHLSGLDADFYELNPIKLIIDEMRLISTAEGYQLLNLGGGRGGSNEDSLFRFKSGFSKEFKNFRLWKYIVNHDIYNKLTNEKFNQYPEVDKNQISFFPQYRATLTKKMDTLEI